MRISTSTATIFAMGIGIMALSVHAVLAQSAIRKPGAIEGFRELKWGTSIEQASKSYADMAFEKYVVANGREEPWKVYVRKEERGEIENVGFDSIEYWFKGNHLLQVRAVLHSRIGPRTLVTRAESAFEKLAGRLSGRYGSPTDRKTDYLTEWIVVVKEATWTVNHSAITIRYEGTGRTNEDLLTLILQGKPGR